MITINYVKPASHKLPNLVTNLETPWGPWYLDIVRCSYGSCSFGFAPKQGPRSLNGDRDCDHWNIKGSITQNLPTGTGPGFTCGGLSFPGYPANTPSIPQPRLVCGPGFSCGGTTPWVRKWYNSWYWSDSRTEDFSLTVSESDNQLSVRCSWYNRNVTSLPTDSRTFYETYIIYTFSGPLPKDCGSSFTAAYTCVRKMKNTSPQTSSGTKTFNLIPGIPEWSDVAQREVVNNLLVHVGLLVGNLPAKPPNFSEGVEIDAVESCKVVKINTLALAVDLASLKSVATWARAIPKIRTFRQAASSYLGYKYGAPLTASDVIKLVQGLGKVGRRKQWRGKSIARSRGSFSAASTVSGCGGWTCDYNVKLYYTPIDKAWTGLRHGLMDYGLYPSRKNLWDFIPYSFTLDWIANVSDYLDAADAEDYLSTIDIRGVVRSTRYCTTIPGSCLGNFGGTVQVVLYNRAVCPTLILDDPSFQISNPSNHLLEGGALILARSKF